jgi:hypothetical protein
VDYEGKMHTDVLFVHDNDIVMRWVQAKCGAKSIVSYLFASGPGGRVLSA